MPWHVKAKGGYARGSAEANDNVDMIYSILYNLGAMALYSLLRVENISMPQRQNQSLGMDQTSLT